MKIRKKDLLIQGGCRGCGSCCNSINLQTSRGWVRSERDFLKVCERYPEYERFNITGLDDQGFLLFTCEWVTKEGMCQDYQKRLKICKSFPDKSLHFCGGSLPENCGYSIKMVTPFNKVLQQELKRK